MEVVELNFYIVHHLEFTNGVLPPTSAEKNKFSDEWEQECIQKNHERCNERSFFKMDKFGPKMDKFGLKLGKFAYK